MPTKTYTFDENLFSDFYKDTYGIRPRNHSFYNKNTTNDERQEMWDNLMDQHDAEMEQYHHKMKTNSDFFEKLVEKTIGCGAKDRETAIKWLIQGLDFNDYDLMYGGGYVAYKFDLPSNYEKEFDAVIATM